MESVLLHLAIFVLQFIVFPLTHQVSLIFKVIAIIAIACVPYYTSADIEAPSA
jgi:hypothetical protein